MKKSFMTRVLATGLSVAMAFSLSAATNVTTASAAVKKASTTTFMKVATKSVTEGKTTTTYMKSTVAKKYRIKSHTESSVAKKYISVVMTSGRKGLKITAKDGAVTNAGLEKKGVNVKINFAAAKSVAAVKKAKATKYVNLKVAVMAAKEEVTKQAIVSAEVTGVKTITLTMAKDVASVESPVAITVKKATSDRPCKASANGKTITLAMDAKLMAGDYTVTITGMEDEPLTATVNVEKEETLDHYEISPELIATANVRTEAIFYYSAKNQYGENMVAADPNASCSFGNAVIGKSATATAEGYFVVSPINEVLAIVGTTGTVVLVDPTVGVTSTATVTYSSPATAKEAEVVGTYNINKAKMQNITAGDKIADYELLLTAKDQYGHAQSDTAFNSPADTTKKVTISLVGGLTHVTTVANYDWKTRTIDGVDYIAVQLDADSTSKDGLAVAGNAQYTIVNPSYGLLKSDSLTISDRTIIKSFTISADNGLYESEDNEMAFEAIDTEGNPVTDYATLYELVNVTDGNTSAKYMKWVRKADGTAKLIYNPGNLNLTSTTEDFGKMNIKHTTVVTKTVYCNEQTSSNYLVKTFTWNAKEKRYAQTITGLKGDTVTAVSTTAGDKKLEIKTTSFLEADQYGNSLNKDDGQFVKLLTDSSVVSTAAVLIGSADASATAGNAADQLFQSHANTTTGSVISVFVQTNAAFNQCAVTSSGSIVMTASGIAGTNTVYVKLLTRANVKKDKNNACDKSNYDYKFTVTATGTGDISSSSAKVDSVYGGYSVPTNAGDYTTVTKSAITVKATAAGQAVTVPTDQWEITGYENNTITNEDVAKGLNSKDATVKIRVTTWDKTGAPVVNDITGTFKIALPKYSELYKVTGTIAGGKSSETTTQGALIATTSFAALFYGTDKHGTEVAQGTKDSVVTLGGFTTGKAIYTIEAVEIPDGARQGIDNDFAIWSNGTDNASIKFSDNAKTGTYKFTLKAKTAEGTEKSVTLSLTI